MLTVMCVHLHHNNPLPLASETSCYHCPVLTSLLFVLQDGNSAIICTYSCGEKKWKRDGGHKKESKKERETEVAIAKCAAGRYDCTIFVFESLT